MVEGIMLLLIGFFVGFYIGGVMCVRWYGDAYADQKWKNRQRMAHTIREQDQ